MSDFTAEGNLVIESIENNATADLQDKFAVNASNVASGGTRGGRGQGIRQAVDHLDRTVDLAETRNDLLRELLDTNESGDFSMLRSLKRLGKLTAGGAALTAGALSTLAVSKSPNDGPQPGPRPDPGGTGDTSESDVVDPTAVAAANVIAQGATVTPADLLAGQAAVTAADIVQDKARVTSESVISDPAVVNAVDLIAQGATIGASATIGSTAAVAASDVIDGPVAPNVGDIIDPVTDISAKDVVKAIGIGGVAGSMKKLGSSVSLSGSSAGGVGAPPVILPQLLDTLNDFTSQSLPGFGAGRGRRRPTRQTTVNNETTVTVQQDASLDRREKQDIIDSAVEDVKSSLERRL
ncbi:hypothetical protein [Haloarcula argentinensis]|uniref:hypothetical protein n=1 Tax=Haloarcula argentinensis TaxID=43776 RepID=UPI0002B15B82|nr:hypothetical protein [Haloarcula argentinensis]EMA19006.1 hypothetical protein C443_17888 [Haloarcula argentinensis DSM 12282]